METVLCFDFGNTRLKCGVFIDGRLTETRVLVSDEPSVIRPLLDEYTPDKMVLASVVHHHPELETLLRAHGRLHVLSHLSRLPLSTPVGKPETIGADRLAMMTAALTRFPGVHLLVIGLGSAITYNYVDKYGEFLGGSISPGMEMRFKSLHHYTAKLPLVEADWNYPLIGSDTRTNILSGVLLGMAKEVDGVIGAYQDRYKGLEVVMTGGDTLFFSTHLTQPVHIDPDLVFKGLYTIGQWNIM
ncbi:type III pantothenate kinase [Dinghuibacter silviterrae]|uniref:Type III pantothenate kinase n=1 Tax=Dinghuibacter silviterrae TaxID=1539049 RepID=A0A4R8DP16_9BACT|nr:type III pantothenate kinase [Dinghuibacter silviterrae]TDW99839.1 type III pantothenate kinase [Dinghuibacter silviterrae]